MNDRLEEFIRANRESFDVQEPDPSLWLKISPGADALRQKHRLTWLRYAASIAVIFAGISAGLYYLGQGTGPKQAIQGNLSKEIRETEVYYTRLVNKKYIEVKKYLAHDEETQKMIASDLHELDEIYRDLKKDLADDISNQEVIEAMVQNYRVKLEILEDLLSQLKEKEDQDHENKPLYSL